jgi:hypothetical protein
MGLTQSVHSAARLPYAPPPTLIEPELPEAVLPNSVPGDSRSARQWTVEDPVRRLDVPENVPDKPAFEARVADHAAFVPDVPRASIGPTPVAAETGQAGFADEESPAESVADLMPRNVRRTIDADSPNHEPRVSVLGPAPMVEPLLPPQRAMHSPAWNARNRSPDSSRGPASASGAGEATEVHVTIGRIEVTAVHEAPPSKRRTPPSAKPMTLEEYLARRRGERP